MNNRKLSKKEKKELQNKLITAASMGDIKLIEECQKSGADINADVDGNYDTNDDALHTAIKNNQESTVVYLMHQVMYGIYSVAFAIECKNYKLAQILLISVANSIQKRSEEYLQQTILKPIDGIENTACQSIKNIINIERKLIRDKINDLIRTGKYTLTPLDEELIKQKPYLLHEQFIREGGINDLPNTPLLITILRDQTDLAKKLIGLDLEKKSLNISTACYMANNTPLVLALKRGNREIAKALITAGANVNGQGFRGFTPLHWACILRLNDIIDLLLTKGANAQIVNAFGRKPADYYISDITSEDISFSPSCANISGTNIEMDDIAYNQSNVTFVTAKEISTLHKEPSKHNFATKVPDYSDLYWHITGILKNLDLNHLLVTNSDMSEAEKFNLYAIIFTEIRSQYPVKKELVEQMKKGNKEEVIPISLFNNSLDTNQSKVDPNVTVRPPTPPIK